MIEYPIDPVATAGRWCRYRLSTQEVLLWGQSWPRTDGMPREGANPDIAYLLVSDLRPRAEDFDERFRDCIEGPVEIVVDDLPPGAPADQGRVGTLTRTYQTPLKSADQILLGVSAVAADRANQVIDRLGIRPADTLIALNAVRRLAAGLMLNTTQQERLALLGGQIQEWLDTHDAAERRILDWCVAHPGQMPDVSESAWPALPVAGA